jgi:hypothetical protein
VQPEVLRFVICVELCVNQTYGIHIFVALCYNLLVADQALSLYSNLHINSYCDLSHPTASRVCLSDEMVVSNFFGEIFAS